MQSNISISLYWIDIEAEPNGLGLRYDLHIGRRLSFNS